MKLALSQLGLSQTRSLGMKPRDSEFGVAGFGYIKLVFNGSLSPNEVIDDSDSMCTPVPKRLYPTEKISLNQRS